MKEYIEREKIENAINEMGKFYIVRPKGCHRYVYKNS